MKCADNVAPLTVPALKDLLYTFSAIMWRTKFRWQVAELLFPLSHPEMFY